MALLVLLKPVVYLSVTFHFFFPIDLEFSICNGNTDEENPEELDLLIDKKGSNLFYFRTCILLNICIVTFI